MFLIPLAREFDWRHPPVVTFLIVLVNVLVYVVWQRPNEDHLEQALEHYFESGLAGLEFPAYARYLAQRQRAEPASLVQRAMAGSEQDMVEAVYVIEADEAFLRLLHAGQIVMPHDRAYPAWREALDRFDRLFAEDWDWHHSLIPVLARWDTWLTHLFMHADWAHLIGNMIVLLVVGFVVEQVLGGWLFLLFYLLGGLGAAAAFCAMTAFETDQERFQRAMTLAESWRLDEAGAILDELTARRPDDYELLNEAYKVVKLAPDSPHYHNVAGRILALPAGNRAVLETITDTFREYLQIARPRPRLSIVGAAELAQTFSAAGLLGESERLAEMLAKQQAPRLEVTSALLAVGEALLQASEPKRAGRWLQVVAARFPGSPQGDRARALTPPT